MRFLCEAIPSYMYEFWFGRSRSQWKKDPTGFFPGVTEQKVCLVATVLLFSLKLYEETGELTESPVDFSPANAERISP